MHKILFISLFIVGQTGLAQFDPFPFQRKNVDVQDYIHYFPFYKGVQMIRIDHNQLFEDRAVAADPWNAHRMSSAPPSYYTIRSHSYTYPTYIFRDSSGTILNCYPSRDYKCQFKLQELDSSPISWHINTQLQARTLYSRQQRVDPNFLFVIRDELGKFGLMDSLGRIKLSPQYDSILYRNKTYLIRIGNFWGVLNSAFKPSSPLRYSSLKVFGNKYFLAEKGGCYGIVNLEGKEIVPLKYDQIHALKGATKLSTFRIKGELGIMDSSFRIVQGAKYSQVLRIGMTYRVLLRKHKRFGLLDPNGKELLPAEYMDIYSQGSYNLLIRKYNPDSSRNFYGLLDQFGNFLLPVEYDAIYWVRHKNHFAVRKGRERYIIDRNGKRISEE